MARKKAAHEGLLSCEEDVRKKGEPNRKATTGLNEPIFVARLSPHFEGVLKVCGNQVVFKGDFAWRCADSAVADSMYWKTNKTMTCV
jgi:hypothetical protein